MSKIVSITTVKNEADIIESFVRYHLNIVDLMIILNNGSTDYTNVILEKLLAEGLPIVVINDEDKYFEPMEKYNFLLKKAVNDYNADIICPLDVDEFLTSDEGNPRDIIQNMPPFTFYKIKWRTYVPSKNDNNSEKFIPLKITNIRDENIETFYKVILTRDLSYHYNARLSTGNHNLRVKDNFKDDVNCEERFDLRIAHFPLRSVEQMTSKILVSYPNVLSRKNVNPNMSHHYPLMFNKFLNDGSIDINDVVEFAKQYSLEENKGKTEIDYKNILVKEHPINLDFCKDIDIKYPFVLSPLKNVLENYVYFANEIHNFKKDKESSINNINEMEKEKDCLQNKFKEKIIQLGDKDKEIRILNNSIHKYEENINFLENLKDNYDLEINDLKNSNNELHNVINNLNNSISNKNDEIVFLNKKYDDKVEEIVNLKNNYDLEINDLKNSNNEMKKEIVDLSDSNNEMKKEIVDLSDSNNEMKKEIVDLNNEKILLEKNNKESLNSINALRIKLIDANESLIENIIQLDNKKSKLKYLKIENDYYKNHNNLLTMFTSNFSYLYLIFKSKPGDIKINIKLFKELKESELFDVGFYLSKYPDLIDSKVCNLFSAELHYVCNGFYENRLINSNFSKIGDKKLLLDMIYDNR